MGMIGTGIHITKLISDGRLAPFQVPNFAAGYKADGIPGLNPTDLISTWPDYSGNGRDLIQTGVFRPEFDTDLQNGLPGVKFDGTDDNMSVAYNISALTEMTIFAVYFPEMSLGGQAGVVSFPDVPATPVHGFDIQYTDFSDYGSALKTNTASSIAADFTAPDTEVIQVVSFDASLGTLEHTLRRNGALSDSQNNAGATIDASDNKLYLGAISNSQLHMVGNIYEVLIYERALTPTEISFIETYLNDKWAIF